MKKSACSLLAMMVWVAFRIDGAEAIADKPPAIVHDIELLATYGYQKALGQTHEDAPAVPALVGLLGEVQAEQLIEVILHPDKDGERLWQTLFKEPVAGVQIQVQLWGRGDALPPVLSVTAIENVSPEPVTTFHTGAQVVGVHTVHICCRPFREKPDAHTILFDGQRSRAFIDQETLDDMVNKGKNSRLVTVDEDIVRKNLDEQRFSDIKAMGVNAVIFMQRWWQEKHLDEDVIGLANVGSYVHTAWIKEMLRRDAYYRTLAYTQMSNPVEVEEYFQVIAQLWVMKKEGHELKAMADYFGYMWLDKLAAPQHARALVMMMHKLALDERAAAWGLKPEAGTREIMLAWSHLTPNDVRSLAVETMVTLIDTDVFTVAELMVQAGKSTEAIDFLEVLVGRFTYTSVSRRTLAFLLVKNNEIAQARKCIDEVPRQNLSDFALANVLIAEAEILRAEGDAAAADQTIRKAMSLDPSNAFIVLAFAQLAMRDGLPEQAKRLAAQLLEECKHPDIQREAALLLHANEALAIP